MEKVVLHIGEDTLRAAFDVAKVRGMDLSSVVEEFLLRFISMKRSNMEKMTRVSDDVRTLAGMLASEKNEGEDWKERKGECLREKYGI